MAAAVVVVVVTSDLTSPSQARPPAPADAELQGPADVLLPTGCASSVQGYGHDAVVVRGSTATDRTDAAERPRSRPSSSSAARRSRRWPAG